MLFFPRSARSILGGRSVLWGAAAVVLMLAGSSTANAMSTVVVPAGGGFEQAPLLYSTSDVCGLLCTISTSRQAEASNHYLSTKYASLAGIIGTSTGRTTITSPQFTWNQPTPSAVLLSLDRRSALGSLIGLGGGVSFTATLVDDTSSTTTAIAAEALTASEPAFHALSSAVPRADIVEGHTYHLVLTEEFTGLLGVTSTASVDIDNVGLEVTPAPALPMIGSTSVSAITEHSASASSAVDARGEETTYALEYGTTTAYGSLTPIQIIPAGSGGSQQVSAALAGLVPGTEYHLRFVLNDAAGTVHGADVAFTTAAPSPPTLSAARVGSITASGAILSATVNPGASDTGVEVEYGTSTAYGLTSAIQTIPGGSGAGGVQIQLSGLTAGTTYHADVIATNADGSAESEDLVFTTLSGSGPAEAEIGPTSAPNVTQHDASIVTAPLPGGPAPGPGTTTSASTSVSGAPATCLRGQTRHRGLALHLLSVPVVAQISPSHPLRVTIAKGARSARRLRYSICGARLFFTRSGAQAQIILRRLTATRRVTLTLPRALGAPNDLTLVTASANRVFRISPSRTGLQLAPKAAGVRVVSSAGRISVVGLSPQITGLLLRFHARHSAKGSVLARVVSSGGTTQSLRAASH